MYKQFLYCLTLVMSMSHLSAATRVAYDPVEQEEDDRGTLTKVVDFVCDAAPYFMSLGALWFCYSMYQTHDRHEKEIQDQKKRLEFIQETLKKGSEAAMRDRSHDKEEIQNLKDAAKRDHTANAALINELRAKLGQQKAPDAPEAGKSGPFPAPKPIKIEPVATPVDTPDISPKHSHSQTASAHGSDTDNMDMGSDNSKPNPEADSKKAADQANAAAAASKPA